jgi:hypothetical protein
MVDEIGTLHDVLARIQTEANQTASTARRARADGSHIVKLSDVAAILRDAPRIGAETDDPEGSRSIQISDTLAGKMAASLDEAGQELDHANAAAEEAKTFAKAAQAEVQATERRQLAAEALAKSNLPAVSVERDAAFAVELADLAVKAESDEAAQAAVDARIAERRADLHATRSDNTPGLPDAKPNARATEAKKALSSIRRTTGLPN